VQCETISHVFIQVSELRAFEIIDFLIKVGLIDFYKLSRQPNYVSIWSVSALSYAQRHYRTLRESVSCVRLRLSDLNKGWIDQVLVCSIDCNRSEYIMKVFLFFLYVLYERRYCDSKYESETFIKKKLRNVVVVVVDAAATEWG